MNATQLTRVKISGLTCHACQKLVEKFLKRIEGVEHVHVDIQTGKTEVLADRIITHAEIEHALENTAYQVER